MYVSEEEKLFTKKQSKKDDGREFLEIEEKEINFQRPSLQHGISDAQLEDSEINLVLRDAPPIARAPNIPVPATVMRGSKTLQPRRPNPADVSEEMYSCRKQRLELLCDDGKKQTQFVLRWFVKDGICDSYPWGYCPGSPIASDRTLRTKAECESLCLQQKQSSLLEDFAIRQADSSLEKHQPTINELLQKLAIEEPRPPRWQFQTTTSASAPSMSSATTASAGDFLEPAEFLAEDIDGMPVSVLTIEEEIERPPELVESKNDDRYRFQNKETYSNEELRHTINEIKSKLNVSTSTQKTFRDNLPTTTMTDNLIRIGAEKLIDPFRNHQPVEPELEALNEVSEPPDFEANNRADELVLLTEKPKIVGPRNRCEKVIPFRATCAKDGTSSQFTLRWYYREGAGCFAYPYGYCQGELRYYEEPVKTQKECLAICATQHGFRLI